MRRVAISLAAFIISVSQPAVGQDLMPARDLSARLANAATMAAYAECTRLGHRVAVVVTDRSGHERAAVRGDGAGPHALDAARQKAYTSASSGSSTLVWSNNLRRGLRAPDPNLVHLEGVLIIGGGLPIKAGDQVVGAIGVAGAPGAELDDQCAESGISAIQGALR